MKANKHSWEFNVLKVTFGAFLYFCMACPIHSARIASGDTPTADICYLLIPTDIFSCNYVIRYTSGCTVEIVANPC